MRLSCVKLLIFIKGLLMNLIWLCFGICVIVNMILFVFVFLLDVFRLLVDNEVFLFFWICRFLLKIVKLFFLEFFILILNVFMCCLFVLFVRRNRKLFVLVLFILVVWMYFILFMLMLCWVKFFLICIFLYLEIWVGEKGFV